MNLISKKLTTAVLACTALVGVSSLDAQTIGQWDFNAGNLNGSGSLGALTYADAATSSGTAFGTTTSFLIPNIAGSPASVMRFPIATNGGGYLMPTPADPNGGGSLLNEWTLLLDVLYPSASDALDRPLIDTDVGVFVPGPDFIVSASDGLGSPPSGPYNGSIQPNVWYRLGIVVTASEVDTYIDGAPVGLVTGAGLDNRFALPLSGTALILGTTATKAALGYVNSIQLRTNALSPGQMLALGAATAAGIPQVIPPVPSFIRTRTPGVNATGINPLPAVHVLLDQGDTTVNDATIKLYFDGVQMDASVVSTAPTFDINANVTNILDPNSIHTLSLAYSDSVLGLHTNTWSFNVAIYQNLTLPSPFFFEDFDSLSENPTGPGPLPPGWSVANQTTSDNPGYDITDRDSDAYLNWELVSSGRFSGWGSDRTDLPPIVLNGSLLPTLTSGNLMWAESDQRCGGCQGQFQELFSPDISCVGRSNVFVAWNSIYEQNQDNMNLAEYSIDQGAHWLPVYYMFCTDGNGETSDIIYTNNASGKPIIDVGQTFSRNDNNRNWAPDTIGGVHATNYGIYAYTHAPINTGLIPYIVGKTNDDTVNGKEIVIVRLAQADGQAHVRLRWLDDGTSSWFWGIDNVGLYEINTPNITGQPQSQTVSAGATATFTVAATSSKPITYRWRHAGTNVPSGAHFSGVTNATLTISNCDTNDAGIYTVVVGNSDGNVTSAGALLTVVTAPLVTTQPLSVVRSINYSAAFSVAALGRAPLHYQWTKDGTPVGGNSTGLSFAAVQLSDAGRYQVTITNSEGSAVSAIARLIVSPPDINSNLVVHIKFDGDYTDSSGRTNDASPVGGPTLVAGKIGQAMKFTTTQDGSTIQYASLGYPDDLKFGTTTDASMSFWVNYSLQVDDPPMLSNKNWDSSGNKGWGLFTQPSKNMRINFTGSSGTKYDFTSSTPPTIGDGLWHNIVFSFARGAIGTAYVDGALLVTRPDLTTGTIDTDDLSYTVNIGQDGRGTYTDGGSAGITNALIDDVGIWRRALSGPEAAAIYTAGNAGKDLSQAVSATLGVLSVSLSGANVVFNWQGAIGVRLQRSTTVSPSAWADVAGTVGNSTYSEPASSQVKAFYRLYKP